MPASLTSSALSIGLFLACAMFSNWAYPQEAKDGRTGTIDPNDIELTPKQKDRARVLGQCPSVFILQYRMLMDTLGPDHTHVKRFRNEILTQVVSKFAGKDSLSNDLADAYDQYSLRSKEKGLQAHETINELRRISIASRLLQTQKKINLEYIDEVLLELF